MYKHRNKKPVIHLIENASSRDKKALEAVENQYISEYAEKYGKNCLNKRCHALKTRKIQYEAKIETKSDIENRIADLDKKKR